MSAPRLAIPLVAALSLGAACAPAAAPAAPATPAAPAVPEPASLTASPTPPTTPEVPTLSPRPAPAPLREALPPLTKVFARVQIKGVKEPFIAVGGSGPRDVLFLTGEGFGSPPGMDFRGGTGIVYQTDGEKVVERMVPCGYYSFGAIAASRDEIRLDGQNMYYRGVPGRLWSSRARGKRGWACSETFRSGFAVASGGRVWRYECVFEGCAVRSPGLPDVPVPGLSEGGVRAMWMRAADDGWVVVDERGAVGEQGKEPARSSLFRFNGVTWEKRASLGDLAVLEMWVDGEDHVWILAERGTVKRQWHERVTGNAVLRFDGKTLEELSLPVGFAASMLRATGPLDVWFLGAGRTAFQWDGRQLRQGEVPFELKDAWAAPGGEVWVVGDEAPGVAARTMAVANAQGTAGGGK